MNNIFFFYFTDYELSSDLFDDDEDSDTDDDWDDLNDTVDQDWW